MVCRVRDKDCWALLFLFQNSDACAVNCTSDYKYATHTLTHSGQNGGKRSFITECQSNLCARRCFALAAIHYILFSRMHNRGTKLHHIECSEKKKMVVERNSHLFSGYSPVARYVRAFGNFRKQNEICLVRHFSGGVLSQRHKIINFHVRRLRLVLLLQCGAMVYVRRPMKTIKTASAQIA